MIFFFLLKITKPLHDDLFMPAEVTISRGERGVIHIMVSKSKFVYIKDNCIHRKVHIYLEPLSRKRMCSSPREPKVEGHNRLRVRGWGIPIRTNGEEA